MFNKVAALFWGNRNATTNPAEAYDIWSKNYDEQSDNLLMVLDEMIFEKLINRIHLKDKIIADIGCGTGRHWNSLLRNQPRSVIGFDVSNGMLNKLLEKFPDAATYLVTDNFLPELEDASCDVIISTLTLGYIPDLRTVFDQWQRVLKIGGEIIITDFHPELLARGGKRTFSNNGKSIAIKNYLHPLKEIFQEVTRCNWELMVFEERIIDETVKSYYENKGSLHIFEQFKGVPVIYGMHLKNNHVTA